MQDAAKKYFSRNNARIVIVGKGSEVLPRLEKLNIPIRYFDKNGNEISKPEQKEVGADLSAATIFSKYIAAIGGEKAANELQSIAYTSKATVQGQEMTTTVKQTASGKSKMEVSIMGMTMMKTVFDGTKGYMTVQGQKKDLEKDQAEEIQNGIVPELKLMKSADAKVAGIEAIEGNEAYKVLKGNKAYFYDVKSGFKVAEETSANVNGQSMTQRILLSNYKPVGNLLMPYTQTLNMMGMEIMQQISDVKVNEVFPDSDFQ